MNAEQQLIPLANHQAQVRREFNSQEVFANFTLLLTNRLVTRRKFFEFCGVLFTAMLLLQACTQESASTEQSITPDQGIIDAAGVYIVGVDTDDKEYQLGQGGLVEDKNGNLAITTIDHIANNTEYKLLRAYIKGLTTGVDLDADKWEKAVAGFEDILTQTFNLTADQQSNIEGLIAEGKIKPLIFTPANIDKVVEVAAVDLPDKSQDPWVLAFGLTQAYAAQQGLLVVVLDSTQFCQGTSGAPVLLVEDNQVTNKVIGLVVGGPEGTQCANEISIVPVKPGN